MSECQNVTVVSCELHSNVLETSGRGDMGIGGAMYVEDSEGLILFNSTMSSNVAQVAGGGLYATNSDQIRITNSTFDGNEALDGAGSAVWLSSPSSNNSISFNIFQNNRALRGSGTVHWQASPSSPIEPKGLSSLNVFTQNKAQRETGADSSSSSVSLLLAEGLTSGMIVSTSDQFLPLIKVSVVDYYGHLTSDDLLVIVRTNSSLNHCGSNEALKGGVAVISIDSVSMFDDVAAVCGPKGHMVLIFEAALSVGSVSSSMDVSFEGCSVGEYLEGGRCHGCGPGTYLLSYGDEKKCLEGCPTGALTCERNVIKLRAGWWREKNSTAFLFECPYGETACLGGEKVGAALCREGYEGPLCAVCSEGYYFQSVDSTCQSCPQSQALNVFSIVLIIVLGATLMLAAIRNSSVMNLITDFSLLSFFAFISRDIIGVDLNWESEEFQIALERATCKSKIYVTLFQILSSFPFVLQLSFPATFSKIMSFGSIVNLNIFNDAALNCDYRYDYIDFLLIVTIVPAILTALWVMMYTCQYSYKRWYQLKPRTDASVVQLYSTYLKVFLVSSFLALPGISIFIFRTFNCQDLDPSSHGGRYLRSDYSISCESARYEWGRNYAVWMVFVYPVGVTCYYFWLLYSHRGAIRNRESVALLSEEDHRSIEPFNLLFSSYQPRYWYWEVIETIRRLLLTGVLALFNQGSGLQIVFAFVISLFFLKLYGYFGELT